MSWQCVWIKKNWDNMHSWMFISTNYISFLNLILVFRDITFSEKQMELKNAFRYNYCIVCSLQSNKDVNPRQGWINKKHFLNDNFRENAGQSRLQVIYVLFLLCFVFYFHDFDWFRVKNHNNAHYSFKRIFLHNMSTFAHCKYSTSCTSCNACMCQSSLCWQDPELSIL